MKYFFYTFTLIILSACATLGLYSPPASTDVAYIAGVSNRTSMTVWDSFLVESIDNQFVSKMRLVSRFHEWAITPGEHTVLVHALFQRGYGGSYSAFIPIKVNLEPSKKYILNGKVEGDKIEVWLEDKELKTVISEKFSSNYNLDRSQYNPIFIYPSSK
jgi:hypothetical protein